MLSDEEKKMLEIFKKEVEKEQNEYEQVKQQKSGNRRMRICRLSLSICAYGKMQYYFF